jgi:hypothetical protein
MSEGLRFVPRISHESQERREMLISEQDRAQMTRTPGDRFAVTDLITGDTVTVEMAECSIPRCFCDAVIVSKSDMH